MDFRAKYNTNFRAKYKDRINTIKVKELKEGDLMYLTSGCATDWCIARFTRHFDTVNDSHKKVTGVQGIKILDLDGDNDRENVICTFMCDDLESLVEVIDAIPMGI